MEYNKESFKKALKECGIIRWENHFEKVVKAYLKAEDEQLIITVVMWRCDEDITDLHQNTLFTKGLVYEQINVDGQFILKDNILQSTDCSSFDDKFSYAS